MDSSVAKPWRAAESSREFQRALESYIGLWRAPERSRELWRAPEGRLRRAPGELSREGSRELPESS
eukprot:1850778-Alexandrium_andersonii.AAC.1